MDRRVSGSEFHIAGPDPEKARVPNCVLVRWMTAALFVDDRSLYCHHLLHEFHNNFMCHP